METKSTKLEVHQCAGWFKETLGAPISLSEKHIEIKCALGGPIDLALQQQLQAPLVGRSICLDRSQGHRTRLTKFTAIMPYGPQKEGGVATYRLQGERSTQDPANCCIPKQFGG